MAAVQQLMEQEHQTSRWGIIILSNAWPGLDCARAIASQAGQLFDPEEIKNALNKEQVLQLQVCEQITCT